MVRIIRSAVRCLPTLGLLLGLGSSLSAERPTPAPATAVVMAERYTPVVHLRKLHLVRPDLIGYPVDYETFC